FRVHRHHRAAADDVAPAALAGVLRSVVVVRRGRTRRKKACSRGGPSRRRGLQEIAPPEMVLRISFLAKDAHFGFLPRWSPGMTTSGVILLLLRPRVHPIAQRCCAATTKVGRQWDGSRAPGESGLGLPVFLLILVSPYHPGEDHAE